MSTAIEQRDTLAAKILFQQTHCRICEAPDERGLYLYCEPCDPDTGVFQACETCADDYGLEVV